MKYYIFNGNVFKSEVPLVCKTYNTELEALQVLKDKCSLRIEELNKTLLVVKRKIDDIYEDQQNNLG